MRRDLLSNDEFPVGRSDFKSLNAALECAMSLNEQRSAVWQDVYVVYNATGELDPSSEELLMRFRP